MIRVAITQQILMAAFSSCTKVMEHIHYDLFQLNEIATIKVRSGFLV